MDRYHSDWNKVASLVREAAELIHVAQFAAASALIEEADAISEVTGTAPQPRRNGARRLARTEAATLELVEATIEDGAARGEGKVVSIAEYARQCCTTVRAATRRRLGACGRVA